MRYPSRVQCVLGVADEKLITLRLQVPEELYSGAGRNEDVVAEIDAIIDSFTVGNIL